MNDAQYIDGFKNFADKLAKRYTQLVISGNEYPKQEQLWQLELAMYKMENELNMMIADILEQAGNSTKAEIRKLDDGLSGIRQFALSEWMMKNLEIMNNTTRIKKATVLR